MSERTIFLRNLDGIALTLDVPAGEAVRSSHQKARVELTWWHQDISSGLIQIHNILNISVVNDTMRGDRSSQLRVVHLLVATTWPKMVPCTIPADAPPKAVYLCTLYGSAVSIVASMALPVNFPATYPVPVPNAAKLSTVPMVNAKSSGQVNLQLKPLQCFKLKTSGVH